MVRFCCTQYTIEGCVLQEILGDFSILFRFSLFCPALFRTQENFPSETYKSGRGWETLSTESEIHTAERKLCAMSTLTTKKQNHILYVTLAVLLVTAAVLSVLTFNAGKKETENLPETETKQIEQAKPESKPSVKPAEPVPPPKKKKTPGSSAKKRKANPPRRKPSRNPRNRKPMQPRKKPYQPLFCRIHCQPSAPPLKTA